MPTSTFCVRLILLLLASLVFRAADANDDAAVTRRIAVLSSIGDSLSVVTYRGTLGVHVDQTARETMDVDTRAFDNVALRAADRAIRRADASAAAVLLAPEPFRGTAEEQEHWFDGGRFVPTPNLATTLAAEKATQLLLVTKHRAPAHLQLDHTTVGSGVLDGLGYYVDRQLHVRRADTQEPGVGFLAPFAYFSLTLVDAVTGQIIASRTVSASRVFSAARNKSGFDPWNALTQREKALTLEGLVQKEVLAEVPAMLAPAPK